MGREGADTISGGHGNDTLKGESGSDCLRGAAGSDWLWGGSGADVLAGGSGAAYFVFRGGNATDTVRDFRVGVNQRVLVDGQQVNTNAILRADGDLDGRTDTVPPLTNSAIIVLVGVSGAQDRTFGSNAVALSPPNLV